MSAERVRVGDVLQLQRRAVEVEPDKEYQEIGVRSFGKGLFHKEPVNGAELGNKRVFNIEPGDLVLSNVFAWEGAIAVARESELGMIGSHRFMTYVPLDGRIDAAWASWFFRSEPGLNLIRGASPGSAGRNRTLAIKRFENLEIPLPPIETQRRDARRLNRFAEQFEVIAHRRTRSAQPTGALVAAARAKFVSPRGLAAAEHPGCTPALLGDLADFLNGTSYDGGQLFDDGVPIIRISNISDPGSPYVRTRETFDQRFQVDEGDLLVSWSASFKSIIWPGPPGVLNQHIFNVREREGVERAFLRHLIEAVFTEMRKQAVGIGMMHLRRDAFLTQPVLVPNPAVQREIADHLDRVERLTAVTARRQEYADVLAKALQTSILDHAVAALS